MRNFWTRLFTEEDGASAIEYGLIAGLVAVVLVGALRIMGTNLSDLFGRIADDLPE